MLSVRPLDSDVLGVKSGTGPVDGVIEHRPCRWKASA